MGRPVEALLQRGDWPLARRLRSPTGMRWIAAMGCSFLLGCFAPAAGEAELCSDTCRWAGDGECDDGGEGSLYDVCAFGTDCADCGPRVDPSAPAPGGGTDGPPAPGGAVDRPGRCVVDDAISASAMADGSSCILQGGSWSSHSASCSGGPPACAGASSATDCFRTFGCAWIADDGTTLRDPRATSACVGEPVECERLADLDDCVDMHSCDPFRTSDALGDDIERCGNRGGAFYTNNADCRTLSEQLARQAIHPEVAQRLCLQRFGCRWRWPDGEEIPAFDGREPAALDLCEDPAPGEYRATWTPEPRNAPGCPGPREATLQVASVDDLLHFEECDAGCRCNAQRWSNGCRASSSFSCGAPSYEFGVRERFAIRPSGEITFVEFLDPGGDLDCRYRAVLRPR